MTWEGNVRKMKSSVEGEVKYSLPLFDVLNPNETVDMNDLIEKEIRIEFLDQINCVVTGKKINKTFGDGMSWDAFRKSPMAVESIIRPELSRIHEGIALRDEAWERAHHLQPHVTYLSYTSGFKVGVTRNTQIPTRWVDQGAVSAIIIAETPYRQAAGLIEVALKPFIADKTNWRKMLADMSVSEEEMIEAKQELIAELPDELTEFVSEEDEIMEINFPVIEYPEKVKSVKLDKFPIIEKKLMGIKGQYLIFDDNTVMNMRSHTGYKLRLSV